MVNEPEKRVFLALADTARKFEEDRVYAQLREDIDCIKGPLKVRSRFVHVSAQTPCYETEHSWYSIGCRETAFRG